jgi:hypothetical protein
LIPPRGACAGGSAVTRLSARVSAIKATFVKVLDTGASVIRFSAGLIVMAG